MSSRTRAALASVLLATLLSACASLQPRPELPDETALPPGTGTSLDGVIAGAEARHPSESGFRLVREGPEAFAIRSRSALAAGRSLDVQTYIWHDDATGTFLAIRLLEAADRGVKVRLLVDDMDEHGPRGECDGGVQRRGRRKPCQHGGRDLPPQLTDVWGRPNQSRHDNHYHD